MCVYYFRVVLFHGVSRTVLSVSGSFAYYAWACACPCGFAWLSIPCVGARGFSSISLSALPIQGSRGLSSIVFFHWTHCSVWRVLDLGSEAMGRTCGWVAVRAGLWGVPPTWVWVVGFSHQILENPTSICNTGIKNMFSVSVNTSCSVHSLFWKALSS